MEKVQYEAVQEKGEEGERERENEEIFITWVLVLFLPEAHLHPSVFCFVCFDNSTIT